MAVIQEESMAFLKSLAKNNNREWFVKQKARYTERQANFIAFADALLTEMKKHDNIETPSGKSSVFRIYRDVRFSKDKTPYHTYLSGFFKRATKKLRGGYYYHIEPGKSFAGGGFWGPNTDDMRRIRQDIDYNFADWHKMLNSKALIQTFGGLQGDKLTSAPRGYAKDHPAIELLRHKQFVLRHYFTDEEVQSAQFVKVLDGTFKKMRPFLNFMSEVLTTDINGVPIED